jgi:hypothetical protein
MIFLAGYGATAADMIEHSVFFILIPVGFFEAAIGQERPLPLRSVNRTGI